MMIVRGQTANFVVSYDSSLTDGTALADAVLGRCEQDFQTLRGLFGGIVPAAPSLPFQINLVAGPGGASHPGCLSTNITCYASNIDTLGIPSLVVAEEAEVFMATQGAGFDCIASNGEALSRVAAQVLYPELRDRWSTGNSWLNSTNPSRPDWVSNTKPTDQDIVSVGCGSLFLNYLAHQLNFSWRDIIAAAAPTLAGTAAKLGVQNAFGGFAALLTQHFPPNQPANLADDDPFPLAAPPAVQWTPAQFNFGRRYLDSGTIVKKLNISNLGYSVLNVVASINETVGQDDTFDVLNSDGESVRDTTMSVDPQGALQLGASADFSGSIGNHKATLQLARR